MSIARASTAVLFAMTLLIVGCEKPGGSLPDDVTSAWEEAFNKGDAAGVAALYTEDAQLMPPATPLVSGRAAIEAFMRDTFAQSPVQIAITDGETSVNGDHADRRGTYRVASPDGAELETGKFVEVWKRIGGEWKIHWDIWNTDAPTPPADAPVDAGAPPPG